ncbi:MAG: hypothetical protein HXY50_16360, partial [Ignavibacteriaceae bacterium]|nr:hypothetical protein [Ignavibacteriaceae bacterium]
MSKRLVDIIKDDRKYLAIVFFILVILIATGILSPILIENQRENWAATLSEKIADIESKIVNEFHEHEKLVIRTKDYVRNDLHEILDIKKVSYGDIVKAINLPKNKGYSLEVLAPNGKLIAWNSKVAVPQEDLFPLDYPIGETYFVRSDLVTYLTITDTIVTESDIFYIICSLPFEKHYTINNEFYEEISFTKRIFEEYGVHTYIDFDPLGQPEKDGRKYSFPLLNNRRNIIGKVTFTKPILDLTINRLNSQFKIFQSILVTLAIIFFGFGLKQDYLRIKYNSAKIVLLAFYLLVFRYIIYQLEFPSSILPGILSDASYFSSAFAGGWVRSPIEFLITAIFFAILCLKIYHYSTNYFLNGSDEKLKVFSKFFFLIFIPLTIIYFLGLRGLSASIKSVIFDSTLRYFRDPNIIPDLPTLV